MSKHSNKVLLIDDDGDFRNATKFSLESEGYMVLEAPTAEEGLSKLRAAKYDIVLLDLVMPGMSGEDAFEAVHKAQEGMPIVIITGRGRSTTVARLLREGASAVLAKPVPRDELLATIGENLVPPAHFKIGWTGVKYKPDELQGESRDSKDLGDAIAAASSCDDPALVLGETGTGKELVAEAIHELSDRNHGPFVPVNCAGLSKELNSFPRFRAIG